MMAARGTKPKPDLQVVREGNPGKRKRKPGVRLSPGTFVEPDWSEWFGGNGSAIADASSCWQLVVAELDPVGVLADIDRPVLAEAAVCWARIRQCERDITANGIWTEGERGAQKNPAVTAGNQYRTMWKFYVAELGLSPSSRARITGTGGEDGDDGSPFD